MQMRTRPRMYGGIWIVISPLLWLMAAISTVASIRTYYIQLACFSLVASAGLVAGVAALFRHRWALVILGHLSWLGFSYFSGAGLLIAIYGIPLICRGDIGKGLFVIQAAVGVIATGLPFYFLARGIGKATRAEATRRASHGDDQ